MRMRGFPLSWRRFRKRAGGVEWKAFFGGCGEAGHRVASVCAQAEDGMTPDLNSAPNLAAPDSKSPPNWTFHKDVRSILECE